jgi:hypothetical protein
MRQSKSAAVAKTPIVGAAVRRSPWKTRPRSRDSSNTGAARISNTQIRMIDRRES